MLKTIIESDYRPVENACVAQSGADPRTPGQHAVPGMHKINTLVWIDE